MPAPPYGWQIKGFYFMKIWKHCTNFGIFVIICALLSVAIACDDKTTPNNETGNIDVGLNGTWIKYRESETSSYNGFTFDNGNFETIIGVITVFDSLNFQGPCEKGIYVANDGTLSLTIIYLHGDYINYKYQSIGAHFESRWYSKNELNSKEKLEALFINDSGHFEIMINQFLTDLEPLFETQSVNYAVDGRQLILTYTDIIFIGPIETTITFTKHDGPIHIHDWGEWSVITPATETEEGVETRTCKTNPTHTQTRPIPIEEGPWGPPPPSGE
jgi:hypothetical protein